MTPPLEAWRQDWWEEVEPGNGIKLWRKDGLVLGVSAPASFDPQAGSAVVANFSARRPCTAPTGSPLDVHGDSPEALVGAVDAAWGARQEVFPARPGMVVFHDRAVWTIVQAEESSFTILPRHRGQRVLRYALVPYAEQNGRRHVEPFSAEMPVKLWPYRFLILAP